jgi:hypothetical protein
MPFPAPSAGIYRFRSGIRKFRPELTTKLVAGPRVAGPVQAQDIDSVVDADGESDAGRVTSARGQVAGPRGVAGVVDGESDGEDIAGVGTGAQLLWTCRSAAAIFSVLIDRSI